LNERKRQQQKNKKVKKSSAVNNKSKSRTPDEAANSHDIPNQYANVKSAEKGRIMIMLMNSLKKK
jgi:hypothetical protein